MNRFGNTRSDFINIRQFFRTCRRQCFDGAEVFRQNTCRLSSYKSNSQSKENSCQTDLLTVFNGF